MLKHRIQRYFLTGLLTWLPLVITVWVLIWLLGLIDSIFVRIVEQLGRFLPAVVAFSNLVHGIPGIGVLVLGAVILLTGLMVANIVGQWWVRQWGRLFSRIPVFRSVYSSVKQVSDTLLSGSGQAFSKALLVQFPHQGVWTIAFLTGKPGAGVAEHLDSDDFVSVYVPTTPNPTGGYFVMVRKSDCVELEMSVDAALRYIVSMGVVAPADPLLSTPKSTP